MRISKISYNKKRELVCVWLTNAESGTEKTQQKLKEIYEKYNGKQYQVAVFYSGNEAAAEWTAALLRHNKYRTQYGEPNKAI